MKQTYLFVDAVNIEKRGAFDLHLIFTEGKLCEKGLTNMISQKKPENFLYRSAVSALPILITGSMFWP